MGQKAEEQKVSTVEISTSIGDMTGKLSLSVKVDLIGRWDLPSLFIF